MLLVIFRPQTERAICPLNCLLEIRMDLKCLLTSHPRNTAGVSVVDTRSCAWKGYRYDFSTWPPLEMVSVESLFEMADLGFSPSDEPFPRQSGQALSESVKPLRRSWDLIERMYQPNLVLLSIVQNPSLAPPNLAPWPGSPGDF